jgi:transcription initiation factor TFIIB
MERKELGRNYRFLTRELKLGLMPTGAQDYVERFCSQLQLSHKTKMRALELIREAEEKKLMSGRGPSGIAAAAIYIASILCDERRTQREVTDVAGVTEVTIRNRYKEMAKKMGITIDI